MFDMINQYAGYLENASLLSYPISIFLGFLAGIGAITCFLPIIPMAVGFFGGQDLTRKRRILMPLYVLAGSIIVLGVLGVIVSFVGLRLQRMVGPYWFYIIGVVCILVGLFELGLIRIRGLKLPQLKSHQGFWSPLLFGMMMGGTIGIGSSCCVPTLPIVLTYAGIQGNPIHGAVVLTMFAIGQSIPIFAIGLFSSALGKVTAKWSYGFKRIAGVVLVLAGGFLIVGQFNRSRSGNEVMAQGLFSLTTDPALASSQPESEVNDLGDKSAETESESLVSPATTQELNTRQVSSKIQTLTWQDKLIKCSKEKKYAFLFVDNGRTSEGKAIREMLQKVVGKHPEEVSLLEVDFDKERIAVEAFLQQKLRGQIDLSKAIPLVFAIAPNGAFTGMFDKRINEQMAQQSLVSTTEAELVHLLQQGKVVFLSFYGSQSEELKRAKVELGAIEKNFKGISSTLYVKTSDASASSLVAKLPAFDHEQTNIFILVPPGRLIGKLEGSQITRQNLLQAFQAACNCGPGGCG